MADELPTNEWGYPIYPVGTPVTDIKYIDRGQKMVFECKNHPDNGWYASKAPHHSRWFLASVGANPDSCDCDMENFLLTQRYSPTRDD